MKQSQIIVYTAPACPYCSLTKGRLNELGASFTEVDVSKNPDAAQVMVRKSGQMGVPVVEIGGNIIIGWNKGLLDEAVRQNGRN